MNFGKEKRWFPNFSSVSMIAVYQLELFQINSESTLFDKNKYQF